MKAQIEADVIKITQQDLVALSVSNQEYQWDSVYHYAAPEYLEGPCHSRPFSSILRIQSCRLVIEKQQSPNIRAFILYPIRASQ